MSIPGWHTGVLNEGILPEPLAGDSRIVLWLPGDREGSLRHWQRVATAANADVTCADGVCVSAAALVPVRQRVRGWIGRLLAGWTKAGGDNYWTLPTGEVAEQAGP